MNRSKKIILFFLFLNCIQSFAQEKLTEQKYIFKKDTIINNDYVFDYFRQERDSMVQLVSCVILMPTDSLSLYGENQYTTKVSNPKNGFLKVYFKNKLLYKYMLNDNEIKGTGYCYYPFSGNIALQGRFKEGKLHGLVFIQKEDGEILEVMKFKNGIYIKHIYNWLSFSKKSLQARHKNRSSNPLQNNEVIVR